MQKLYDEVGSLDRRCYEVFALSEDILMEHAAEGMARFIRQKFSRGSSVLVVCGAGNNGADGLALARLLHKEYDLKIFIVNEPKSPMAQLQDKRAHAIHVPRTLYLNEADVIVDAIFGTGFNGVLDVEAKSVMQALNKLSAYKIACDIPSGIKANGECDRDTFVADITLTMGAQKKSLYSDSAKRFVGEVEVIELGVARELYETPSQWSLLDFTDMRLPHKEQLDSHKGSYGHLAVLAGEKSGASMMSALAALRFGVGLATLIGTTQTPSTPLPFALMYATTLPQNTTAIACGMGLGGAFSEDALLALCENSLPLLIDADIFSMECISSILKRRDIILTPHPKEFISLLKKTGVADITIEELQRDRFHYVSLFAQEYPNAILLLKGANVIIASDEAYFINPHGSPKLAKGGSGDILSGLIASLLAQGYTPLEATISGSLAHTKLAQNYTGADFSLMPEDLIEGIQELS